MIDASVDSSFAAFERAEARRASQAAHRARPHRPRSVGNLADLPSMPDSPASPSETLVVESPESSVVVSPSELVDPVASLAHLRLARFCLAVVVILIILVLWLRQRRDCA